MVLVDASCRWSHVCLLSKRNVTFARLLAQIIKFQAQFPDYPIKGIGMDNAGEFVNQRVLIHIVLHSESRLSTWSHIFILKMDWQNP